MRNHRLFSVLALFGLAFLGGTSVAQSTSAVEASPVWQFETGMAAWVAPRTLETQWPVALERKDGPASAAERFSPVQLLTRLADGLRNIRYKRGGRSPATGFDCSGFVRYVFRQGIGAELPNTSAAQFHAGKAVARDDLRSGDLVFFRTRGKRVSHVGIYLGDGQFIHAPSSGKTVSVSRLSEHYWSRRYAGARRPDVLVAQQDDAAHGSS